jgi:hypothetical protein
MKRFVLTNGTMFVQNKPRIVYRWGCKIHETADINDAKRWKTKAGCKRYLDGQIAYYQAEVKRYAGKNYSNNYYAKELKALVVELQKFTVVEKDIDENALIKPKIRFSEGSWYMEKSNKVSKNA